MQASLPKMPSRLPIKTKIFYGIGDMATASVVGVIGYLINPFLLNVAGLTPAMVGIILLIKQIWDAINDPFMGTISDRTQHRFGRRKVWIMAATVPLGILFFLSWMVPDISLWGKFAYYLVIAILLDTFYTMHNVPYAALTAEMTDDYKERSRINIYRFAFSLIGSLLATIIFALLTDGAADQQAAYFQAAWIVMIIIFITGFAPIPFSPERNPEIDRNAPRPSLFENFRSAMTVRPFRHVFLLFLCSWSAVTIVQSYIVLYMQYWLRPEGGGNLVLLIVYLQLSAVVFVIFYGWLSTIIGKKAVYFIGGGIWALVFASVFFIQPGQDGIILVLSLLGGGGTAVALLVPFSMLPDVIDYDELHNGERREGVFYGFFAFVNKVARGFALALLSFILGWAGFQEATDGVAAVTQEPAVLLTLRIFVSFLPATIVIISFFIAARYEITEEVHQDILKKLGRTAESGSIAEIDMAG